ncbi:hypothetical protein LNJ08_12120 [Tenacibaculum finnmarkense genomovar ulcerans]|uniref:hypothetical protein n=1 Tax=Tenacibaculum finnmarkense TaxID=2781243 RepID=UPI001E3D53CB|nr:hypothetical protein [Tenacibaculum finnmarkense]MCD8455135.1 hypothetical protein [Tenacibaculum finnmarkense genomovar ulcerans]
MGPNEKKFKNIPNTITKYTPETAIAYYLNESRGELTTAVEIYINDMPFKKYYGGANNIFYDEINRYILKSGLQTVRIRYISENKSKLLRKDFIASITIQGAKKLLATEKKGERIHKYEVPRVFRDSTDKIGTFKAANLPVFEDTFTFKAAVPYDLVGWTESEDLTALKPKELEKLALAAYRNVINIFKQKDREVLFDLFYQSEYESSQSKYYSEEEFKKFTEGLDFVLENASVKFYPLENYTVHIYGNGRVVALENIEYPGESAIQFDFVDIDKRSGKKVEGVSNMRLLLHKPKGSKFLVPIR